MIVVLDWDGTLVDSADTIVQCMRAAASDCSLPVPAHQAVRQIIGLGLPEAIDQLFPDGDTRSVAAVGEAYSKRYRAHQAELPPFFSGVQQSLDSLLALGCVLAVATGKSRRGLDRELGLRGLRDYFQFTRCADETASKPSPIMLQEILAEAGQDKERAVMVGDTEFDMQMASRAGVSKIAVTYGAHSSEQLLRWEPDLIVDEFSTILEWISCRV